MAMDRDQLASVLHPLTEALANYPVYQLDESRWQIVSHGGFLDQSICPQNAAVVRLDYQNNVKALYQFDEKVGQYRPFRMFIA